MRMTMVIAAAMASALGSMAAGGADGDGGRMSAEAIRDCAGGNAPETTLVQNLLIESVDRSGGSRQITTRLYFKRFAENETRITLQVRAPMDLAGTGYLMIDKVDRDQLLLYLPSVERVRRVTGGGAAESMLGTDFSYEDMKQLRSMSAGGELERLADVKVEGRTAHRVALTPPPADESAYERVEFAIDEKTCVPLVIEFFEPDRETPTKRYAAAPDSLMQVGERWLARKATMRNLEDGTHTELVVESVRFDKDVSDSIFNPRTFYLGEGKAPLPGARDRA